MRWLAVIVVTTIVLLATCYTTASADTDSQMLSFLDSGALSADVRVSLGFLYGAGCRPDGLGNPVSTVRGGRVSVCGNPAGLAFLESSGILIDVLPPLGASVSDLADLDTEAASMLDDFYTRSHLMQDINKQIAHVIDWWTPSDIGTSP